MSGVMAGWLGIGLRAQTEQLDVGLRRGRDSIKAFSGDAVKLGRQGMEPLKGALASVGGELSSVAGGAIGMASNLGKAFLVGGPVLAGVTALTAGVASVVGRLEEAQKEADKARDKFLAWTQSASRGLQQLRDDIQGIGQRTETLQGGGDIGQLQRWQSLNAEMDKARSEGGEALRSLTEGYEGLIDASKTGPGVIARWLFGGKTADQLKSELQGLAQKETFLTSQRLHWLEERAAAQEEERKAAEQAAAEKAASKEVETLRREVRELKAKTDLEREILRIRERARALMQMPGLGVAGVEAVSEWRKTAEGAARQRDQERVDKRAEGSLGKVRDMARGMNKGADEFVAKQKKQRDAEWDDLRKVANQSNLEAARRLDSLAKQKKEHADFVRGMQEEVELLRAGVGPARERLLIQRELRENLEQAKGDEKAILAAQTLASTKLAALAKEEAQAAKEKAAAEAQATKERRDQIEMLRKQDITKKFASMPGTGGAFGFGAGTAGFSWTEGSGDMGLRRGQKKVAPAGGKAAQALDLPDLTPEFKSLEAELAKVPPWIEQLTKAVTGYSGSTKRAIREIGDSTASAVGELRRDEQELEREVARMRKAIERAGAVGVD